MKREEKKWAFSLTKKENIFLLRSKIKDKTAWYYLDVFPNKVVLFEKRIGAQSLDLKEYGKILFYGWGDEPPKEIKQKIEG